MAPRTELRGSEGALWALFCPLMVRLAATVVATLCLVSLAEAGPQEELARLIAPWQRAGRWLTGGSVAKRRALESVGGGTVAPAAPAAAPVEHEAEEEREAEEESNTKWGFVLGIVALGATFVCGYMLEQRHVTRLPEAGVGMLIGVFVSGMAILFHNTDISAHEKFDFEFFMTWCAPDRHRRAHLAEGGARTHRAHRARPRGACATSRALDAVRP